MKTRCIPISKCLTLAGTRSAAAGSALGMALTVAAVCAGALAASLAAAPAQAHSDTHAKPGAAVAKEQKPWGIAGDAKAAKRTIELRMLDTMRFVSDRIDVRQGETVRIRVRNDGKLLHEFVLGTKPTLEEHAALMLKFPNMEHDEPYMVHVPPGKTGEIVWTFNRAGSFDFACLIAGHYQAGMVGTVQVTAGPVAAVK